MTSGCIDTLCLCRITVTKGGQVLLLFPSLKTGEKKIIHRLGQKKKT